MGVDVVVARRPPGARCEPAAASRISSLCPRIILPDLSRRGAVHVIVIALIAAALAPQAVGASPPDPATHHLLAAVEASPAAALAARGTASLRSAAEFNLVPAAASSVPEGAEHIASAAAPPSVTMQATVIGSALQWVSPPGGAGTISGTASWYCCTREWGDAAVVALPIALGGHFYGPPGGFSVVVCADRCARIAVGDACGCHWGQVGQKVIDLSPAAWAAITDKDRYVYGIVAVTVYLD